MQIVVDSSYANPKGGDPSMSPYDLVLQGHEPLGNATVIVPDLAVVEQSSQQKSAKRDDGANIIKEGATDII